MAIAKRLENEHLSRSLCPVAAEAKHISTARQTWCRPPPELQLAKFPEPEAKYLHAPSSCLSALQIFYSLSLYINVNETISSPQSYYTVLGVGRDASVAEIRSAYRKLAMKQYSIEELQQMLPEMAQDFGSPSRPRRSVDRGFSRASKWFADDMGREARRKTRLHHPGVELFGSVSH
ncbi:hypothetical protein B296_00029385 [Ensete ventricosum]|uniref:J domain-containing protein n=1 Tax=Ensete ventricosum TaxID=4639 RepID=A0A426ZLI6_ENSVE|nr:hypothetical protein B296_00029385 [Ensete ventricosum]